MRLRRLRVQQFRQFRQPLELDGLHDGINLLVGPNESGKSTLAEAIRAAFFERCSSSSLAHLQPWGDSGAAPEVELDFDWQGQSWRLRKRFLKNARCDLQVGGHKLNGKEAEDRLAALLGYEFAGRGASKPEHHGIPGLLWVQQGQSQQIGDSVASAGHWLQQALGGSLDEITSSAGDRLMEAVQSRRDELLTRTGQPRAHSSYRNALDQLEARQQELQALRDSIRDYREQVDELARLRRQQQETDSSRPWLEQREKAARAQQELDAVARLQQEQQRAEQELRDLTQQRELLQQQLQHMQDQQDQLAQRALDQAGTQQALDNLQQRRDPLLQRQQRADQAHKQARQLLEQARTQRHREQLLAQQQQQQTHIRAQRTALEQARHLQQKINAQRSQLQQIAVDEATLKDLHRTETRLDRLDAQLQAVATRIRWQLQAGQSLRLGADLLQGSGQRLLLQETELHIEGVGQLQLQPGGQDLGQLQRQQAEQQSHQRTLLLQLGVENLAQAEQRASQQQQLQAELAQDRARLDTLAPDGVDELQAAETLAGQQLQALNQQLQQLPAPTDGSDTPPLARAEDAAAQAESALQQAEQALADFRSQLAHAQSRRDAAQTEWQKLHDTLSAPEHGARRQGITRQLTTLQTRQQQLREQVQQRQQQIDQARPQLLQQDVQRHSDSAASLEQAAQARDRRIRELQTRLETLGAQGLEERAAEQAQAVQRLQRRVQELEQYAATLDLLLQLLQEKRQALTQQLQAPLQRHLQHHLDLLFPGARITLDEALSPTAITRETHGDPEHGSLEELSFGAREQMGLIARLAYADLLHEAGRPTLIILDDALVHSDAERLEHMKRILFDAATRHQILLLSCHPDNWQDLGTTPVEMQGLRAAPA